MSVDWAVQATEFANCNCAYGCGCQFNALPDKGFCEAVAGYQITQGNFGDVQLDGLRAAAVWHWPGPVHEGNGTMQIIIDERADDRQRDALAKILSGRKPTRWQRCGGCSVPCARPSTLRCSSRSISTLMSMHGGRSWKCLAW